MSIYYDYNKIMSYNAFINFLHGERGVGKTYRYLKVCRETIFEKWFRICLYS